jgi:hypothetical protein
VGVGVGVGVELGEGDASGTGEAGLLNRNTAPMRPKMMIPIVMYSIFLLGIVNLQMKLMMKL